MNSTNDILRSLSAFGIGRLAAMGIVALSLVGFFAYTITRLSDQPKATLFSDLLPKDSYTIVQRLEAQGIDFEINNNGSQILVPVDQVDRLRLEFAADQLPNGGSIGYELFDSASSLGATSFVQNLNKVRALQGELARTIQTLDSVTNARVHLVIPKKGLFRKDDQPPSASIVLQLKYQLGAGQVKSIRHLVSSAVEGLTSNRVSVVDSSGQLLAATSLEAGGLAITGVQQERKTALENQLKNQIETLVASVVGFGNVKAQVSADLDFSQITETSDQFDPNGQVVRSTQTRENTAQSSERENPQSGSIGADLPESAQNTSSITTEQQANEGQVEETTNYEISRTRRTIVRETGTIKKLSVAVLVNGKLVPDETSASPAPDATAEDGVAAAEAAESQPTFKYVPLSEEELARINTIVRSAVGIDEQRGDTINVVNMQFADVNSGFSSDESLLQLGSTDYIRIFEVIGILIATIIVVFGVVRPLLRKVFDPPEEAIPTSLPAIAGEAGTALAENTDASEPKVDADGNTIIGEGVEVQEFDVGNLVDAAQLEHHLRDTSVKRVGEMVARHPEAATEIIRGWVAEEAA